MNKPVYFSFMQLVDQNTANRLMDLCNKAIASGYTEINLLMNSTGGVIIQGIALYNYLMSLPIPVNTYNLGAVASIANIVFLSGRNRMAAQNATFSFHGSTLQIQGPSEISIPQMKDAIANLALQESKICSVYTERTRLSLEDVNGFFLQAVTEGADFALEKGIIHAVGPLSILPGASIQQI